MSKYTTELRYIVENEKLIHPLENSLSLQNVLKSYPLYNENYTDVITGLIIDRREELNEKIINHYYFREIGFETVPRFLFHLQRKLNEIMKYYNQMYKSADLDFNPLYNIELHESYTHTIDDNSTTNSKGDSTNGGMNTTTNENLNVESDTPPTELTEIDIKSNKYASKTNYDKSTNKLELGTTGHSEGEIKTLGKKIESFEKFTEGSSAGLSFSNAIKQWRDIMVNIDMMIVDELNDLFMNVW